MECFKIGKMKVRNCIEILHREVPVGCLGLALVTRVLRLWPPALPLGTRCARGLGFEAMTCLWPWLCLNNLTAIRFRREQKTPFPEDSYDRNSTESTIHHQQNNPQTSPPWQSHLPLLWSGIDGCTRSDAGNLFRWGWPRVLTRGFIRIYKLSV